MRELAQQLIAGRMAAGVVDDLELIQIDVHHRVSTGPDLGIGQDLAEALMKVFPVGQRGQRVVIGKVHHEPLGSSAGEQMTYALP